MSAVSTGTTRRVQCTLAQYPEIRSTWNSRKKLALCCGNDITMFRSCYDRVLPLRMADCAQWMQINFVPNKILLETNGFDHYLPWLCLKAPWKSHAVTCCSYFSIIFRDKEVSCRMALIRALPQRMADCVQWLQLNFLPHKIFLETNEYNQYLP